MKEEIKRKDGVSPGTDELSSTLMGDAFDLLAEGTTFNVLLVIQDGGGEVASYEFSHDGVEACLEGAREKVRKVASAHGDPDAHLADPLRYALSYLGAVEDESGAYRDALLLEFGEKGYISYSAYSFVEGIGSGDEFAWSEPAPAGETEPLL